MDVLLHGHGMAWSHLISSSSLLSLSLSLLSPTTTPHHHHSLCVVCLCLLSSFCLLLLHFLHTPCSGSFLNRRVASQTPWCGTSPSAWDSPSPYPHCFPTTSRFSMLLDNRWDFLCLPTYPYLAYGLISRALARLLCLLLSSLWQHGMAWHETKRQAWRSSCIAAIWASKTLCIPWHGAGRDMPAYLQNNKQIVSAQKTARRLENIFSYRLLYRPLALGASRMGDGILSHTAPPRTRKQAVT